MTVLPFPPSAKRALPPTGRARSTARFVLAVGLALGCPAGSGCGDGSATPSTPPSASSVSKPAVVLGRPTHSSIVAGVNADAATELYVEYGTTAGNYSRQTAPVAAQAGSVLLVGISSLAADTQYYYRVRYKAKNDTSYATDAEHFFHTKRAAGSPFTFVVQADPHLDANSSTAVYGQTLINELADRPDFMVDLGDTSMVEKCAVDGATLCANPSPATQATVAARYALVRSSFEQVCHSVPLFMALGNHDGEMGWLGEMGQGAMADWALAARKSMFANPEPDGFYSGSADEAPGIGLRQNYYAFEWGNALIVVLDPFTYTTHKPDGDGWGWTLGAAQYEWLARTLAASGARFKFVFSHHLLGGNGADARGGAAFARFFEWGGSNADGSRAFDSRRPGWRSPIHELFVDNGVSAWFHGHDHLYAREELDGVVYQEVPQPSLARYDTANPGAGYGYQGADGVNIFASSGHLRVTVGAADVRVEYVRSVAPADETSTRRNGTIVTSYVIR